jgi:transcription antitermination factor NusG
MLSPRWYALTTKPRCESTTARLLRLKGFEELDPVFRVRRRWSDRYKEIEQQIFPGYVFCSFTYEQRMAVLTTPGVSSIVGFGKQPAAVDDAEIASIRSIVHSGVRAWPWPCLRVGQRVRIEDGCLTGVTGTLVRVDDLWRVVVNIEILQRAVAVEINRDLVRPLEIQLNRESTCPC